MVTLCEPELSDPVVDDEEDPGVVVVPVLDEVVLDPVSVEPLFGAVAEPLLIPLEPELEDCAEAIIAPANSPASRPASDVVFMTASGLFCNQPTAVSGRSCGLPNRPIRA